MDAGELRTPTELLDLDGFEVVAAESDRANKVRRLAVVPTGGVAGVCPGCGATSAGRHACRDRAVVDLPLGGWRTGLTARLWQFERAACGRYFTPPHAALAEGAHATERFLDRLAEWADARRRVGRRPVPRRGGEDGRAVVLRPPGAAPPRAGGGGGGGGGGGPTAGPVAGDRRAVDQKRHRRFCCVLVDHTNGRALDVLESRGKAAVVAWLTANKSGLLADLREVTCDVWDAYADAAREAFGAAVRVTADRFHVMKNFQDRLADARRERQDKPPPDGKAELKGSRWLWVTNAENLAREQRAELAKLKRRFPGPAALHEHRGRLRVLHAFG